jgi:hypothetical protein
MGYAPRGDACNPPPTQKYQGFLHDHSSERRAGEAPSAKNSKSNEASSPSQPLSVQMVCRLAALGFTLWKF